MEGCYGNKYKIGYLLGIVIIICNEFFIQTNKLTAFFKIYEYSQLLWLFSEQINFNM